MGSGGFTGQHLTSSCGPIGFLLEVIEMPKAIAVLMYISYIASTFEDGRKLQEEDSLDVLSPSC